MTAGVGSDFVTNVTLGEIKLVEAGAGDTDKITVLSGIKSGVGASFLNSIALTKEGETADLSIAGAYIPENIVNLIDKIAAVKGQDYAKGLVDMANILAPNEEPEELTAEDNTKKEE